MSRIATCVLAGVLMFFAASCGDDSGGDAAPTIDVPSDATFCSVFLGGYQSALDDAVPATDSGFDESAATITAWAEALRDLAPAEIAAEAEANVGYHQAQQDKQSASDFIPGSNDMHAWAYSSC